MPPRTENKSAIVMYYPDLDDVVNNLQNVNLQFDNRFSNLNGVYELDRVSVAFFSQKMR